MDWNDLRHFLVVARTGSLSAATAELRASPATVGRRIQALEAALGIVLFERRSTGYVLTPGGRDILGRAEAAEAAMIAVLRGAEGGRSDLRGAVRLATGDNLASHLVAPHLPRFRDRYPALRLELVTGMRVTSLSRREADLSLRIIRPDRGDLVRRQVGVVGFGLYAAPALLEASPDGGRDPWRLDLIGWDETLRDVPLAAWLREHAKGPVVATAPSTGVQLALAQAGVGAALLPSFVADCVPELVRLVGPPDAVSFDLWLVAHRDLGRAPRVRAVMDFVADLCRRENSRLRGD